MHDMLMVLLELLVEYGDCAADLWQCPFDDGGRWFGSTFFEGAEVNPIDPSRPGIAVFWFGCHEFWYRRDPLWYGCTWRTLLELGL